MRILAGNLLIFFLLLSCEPSAPVETVGDLPLSYRIEMIDKTYQNCDSTRYECTLASLHYILIEKTDPPPLADTLNAKLQRWMLGDYFPRPEALVDSFLSAYDRVIQANPWMLEEEPGWRFSMHQDVYFLDTLLLTIEEEYVEFTGGAHENYRTSFINFDLRNGSLIEATDLFKPAVQQDLTRLGEQHFRQAKQLPARSSLQDHHFNFENNRFYLPENFGLNAKGITYRYDLYEIGPFSMGEVEFTIPYDELQPFLLSNSPIGK